MDPCIIRRASADDLKVLNKLMYQLHDEHHQAVPEDFKPAKEILEEKHISDYLDAPDAIIFVAVIGKQVVGFITGHFCELISSVSKPVMMGSIDEFYVNPEFRGQGIGKRLLDRSFTELYDYGVTQIFVEVWDFNQKAMNLYQKLGFRHHIHWLRKSIKQGGQ